MATSKDAILAACLQILGVSPTVNPDYDLTVRAALLRVLLSGLTISSGGVISTTQPISVPVDLATATGTLGVGHGGTGLTTVAANRLLYASALDTMAALASANNGVLVTNGSGVPSISVTLPSGLTITAPIFSGSIGSDLLFTDASFDIGKSGATRPRDGFFSRNVVVGGTFTPSGNILADLLFTDATFDIGKSGATRPRDGFFSRNMTVGGTLGVTGTSTLGTVSAGAVTATALTAPGVSKLLKATDSTDTSAGATTVDSVATGTLTAKDTIRLEIGIFSATQATAGLQLYNATDGIKLGDLFVGGASAALNVAYQMTVKIRKRPGSTTAVSCYTVGHDAGGTVVGEWANSGSITGGWVGTGFNLGLRHTGVTAGGTLNYCWAAYLDPGQ